MRYTAVKTPSNQTGPRRLVVESGPHAGMELKLEKASTSIGRHAANALCLGEDTTVSNHHAAVALDASGVIITDLGGRNGILIVRDGGMIRVNKTLALAVGDRICLGSSRIAFVGVQPPLEIDRERAGETPEDAKTELSVAFYGDVLKFRLSGRAPLAKQYTVAYSREAADATQRRLQAAIGSIVEGSVADRQGLSEQLHAIGETVSQIFVPQEVTESLSACEARPLLLVHDSELLGIPWELALTTNNSTWCERFDLARQIVLEGVPGDPSLQTNVGGRRLVIVSAPTEDLHESQVTAEGLMHAVRRSDPSLAVDYLAGRRVTTEALMRALEGADMVYYIGHGVYAVGDSAATGWLLHDGVFTVSHLRKLRGGPRFVFSNACDSARERGHSKQSYGYADQVGVASAFLRAGVEHYLGAAWPIPVQSAAAYAHEFFMRLLDGDSIARSVRLARRAVRDAFGSEDWTWASYILYGEPGARIFPRRENTDVSDS